MPRHYRATLWFFLSILFLSIVSFSPARAAESLCFSETGQCLQGRFLEYWQANGGLAIFGFPISAELWEDGRTVQYFERNRFELHPEQVAPYDVLLGQLGTERLQAAGRDWRAASQGQETTGCRFFTETAHSLCGRFLEYWEANGGLASFGMPITEPQAELSETDGQSRTVQYFERNRFELHPEQAAPNDVLLGLLGSWRANWLLGDARFAPASSVQATVSGPAVTQSPLMTVTLTIAAPGYSGPAEFRLFDGAGRPELQQQLQIVDGAAQVTLISGGSLGKHPAVVLIGGQIAGVASAAYTLDAETSIQTGVESYDELWPRIRAMLQQDVVQYQIDGRTVRGYRSPDSNLLWLRDHVYQEIGTRYLERDMTSALDTFRLLQRDDGSFEDHVGDGGDFRGRVAVEADLEFLFAQGAYQAWQATGDDAWLAVTQPAIERGLAYMTSDPLRWEASLGLVKRPFTIDMWDFEYGGVEEARRQIDDQTNWSIMHGDNTGLAFAMTLMGRIAAVRGDSHAAALWQSRAASLIDRLNQTSWNGTFYVHQVHLKPVVVPGINEAEQLSLSNAYALNREVLSQAQATSILNEYQRRRGNGAFAEWFSIDPAFPAGSFGSGTTWGDTPGSYANGGIMPLVGGELARGAFRWGQESYGLDILRRYAFLISSQNNTSYLWYYPLGNPGLSGNETISTDGWGSSAMLAALIEGAAGVSDQSSLFRDVLIAPHWLADTEVQQADVSVRYAASLGYAAYHWERLSSGLRIQATGSAERGTLRILLPTLPNKTQLQLTIDGKAAAFTEETVGESRYLVLPLPTSTSVVEVQWKVK